MFTKYTLRAAGLGLSLLALGALGANAQITTPDASLSLNFNTDGATPSDSFGSPTYSNSFGLGVGFDPANARNKFTNAPNASTAQAVYNPFIAGSDIAAGSAFQLGVHSLAHSNAGAGTVTIYASIFNFDPNAPTGNVPIGSAVVKDLAIQVTSDFTADRVYYTAKTTLTNALQKGKEYVIAFAPSTDGSNPSSYAIVNARAYNLTGLPSDQASTFKNEYLTNLNNGANGGAFTSQFTSGNLGNPVGYRFYASSVPGPEALPVFASGLAGLFGMKLRRRRRA